MALIECGECNGKVSDKAASCPHCGAPVMQLADVVDTGDRLTTTQQTSKQLKEQVLWAYLVMAIGLAMTVFTPLWLNAKGIGWTLSSLSYGGCVLLGGVLWQVVNQIRIWWHHR
ncbi:hypothetical protein [Aeromonas veronii]|uniref:hypothetical protein n=1 Tax=Aeromonas veronii TaxID=654 RepID=UPI003B9FDF86